MWLSIFLCALLATRPGPPPASPRLVQDGGLAKALREEFERRFAAAAPADVKSLAALAEWAEKNQLKAEAKRAYRKILESDPDHAVAREKLGFVKVNGDWVTKEKAAEIEKANPRKKGGAPAAAPSGALDAAIARNAARDAEEAKRLGAVLGDAPTVLSSPHFSLKGAISRELARDTLAMAEQAYAELNGTFGKGPEEPVFSLGFGRKLHVFFLKESGAARDLVPYLEEAYGKLDPWLKEDLKKNAGGLAANGGYPIAVTQTTVDVKTYVLHQLGQAYIDSLVGGGAPWLTEGFAVYTALRFAGKNNTFCYNPDTYAGNVGRSKKGEDSSYALLAKESAQDKSDTPIEALNAKKLNQLDDKDLAKAFTLVRAMLEREPDEGLAFLRLYDAKALARVIKAAYGLTPAEFDARWRERNR